MLRVDPGDVSYHKTRRHALSSRFYKARQPCGLSFPPPIRPPIKQCPRNLQRDDNRSNLYSKRQSIRNINNRKQRRHNIQQRHRKPRSRRDTQVSTKASPPPPPVESRTSPGTQAHKRFPSRSAVSDRPPGFPHPNLLALPEPAPCRQINVIDPTGVLYLGCSRVNAAGSSWSHPATNGNRAPQLKLKAAWPISVQTINVLTSEVAPVTPSSLDPRFSTCVIGEIRSMSSGLTNTSMQAVPSTNAPAINGVAIHTERANQAQAQHSCPRHSPRKSPRIESAHCAESHLSQHVQIQKRKRGDR